MIPVSVVAAGAVAAAAGAVVAAAVAVEES